MNATTGTALPYTEEGYMKLGRNLARTFLDYYRLIGHIKDKPAATALPKPASITSAANREKEKPATQSPVENEERRPHKNERTARNNQKQATTQNTNPTNSHEAFNPKTKESKTTPNYHSPKN